MRKFLVFLVVFLLGSVGVKGQSLFGPKQIISTNANGVSSVYVSDLDGDGHIDVLSDKITWYKNNGKGSFDSGESISSYLDYPADVFAADLDNDGDIDVLSASPYNDNIAWYKNHGNVGFSQKIVISTTIHNPPFVHAADLDGDSDIDVISYTSEDNKMVWYKNNGFGIFSEEIIVAANTIRASSVHTSDLDNDGDVDILSASSSDDEIVWYKNDGNGNFSTEILISTNADGPFSVYAADLDNDNDIDVLSASQYDDKIAWYENDGNGNFGAETIISTNADGAFSIYAADLDNDNDIDVLSASQYDDKIAWYENDGYGNFEDTHLISNNVNGAFFVYAVDLDNDSDIDVISISPHSNKISWYENLSKNTKIITFTFQDSNENSLYDNNEKLLSNQQLLLQPTTAAQFTNIEGYTYFFVESGEYQLSSESNPLWEPTTPETYNITVTNNSELPTYYFGFKPTRILPRVEPHLSSSITRCNREATYYLHYTNTGTTTTNGTITFETDELMQFVLANPDPDLIEGQKLTWNIADLHPSFENKIQLQFHMPDFNNMGEILETQATVQLFNENEELVYTKSTQYDSEVLCSYDPNDKLARSNLLGQSEFAYLADTILYTVRFQNTGNDTAFNIRIEDVLDKKLDWTTFHPITASHDYRTELNRETGLATFYFDDIMLPDSTTNEVESHGFVTFAIASLADLNDKIEVHNTASIFFDFNPAIVTNTAVLTLIEQVETNIEDLDIGYSIRVFPNPFSDFTTIEVSNLPQGNYRLEVMDILGRKVSELKSDDGEFKLERGDLESGVYFFRVLSSRGAFVGSGKVLVE